MRKSPPNWDALFNAPHSTEYRYEINGEMYAAEDIRDTPIVEKPLMQEPSIGRCCTGSLTFTIKPKDGLVIPRAAPVVAFCRLSDGTTVTDWVEMGHYWVSQRSGTGSLVTLTCRDAMLFSGRTYADKTKFEEWPVSMVDVVREIADLMGIKIDARTMLRSEPDFVVNYPNEDTLMSEVLSVVAAAHGGNFIVTETGQLRLIPYLANNRIWGRLAGMTWKEAASYTWREIQRDVVQALAGEYVSYRPYSTGEKTVTRITLTDSAGNQFTNWFKATWKHLSKIAWGTLNPFSWKDIANGAFFRGGIELTAACDSATQAIVDGIAAGTFMQGGAALLGRSFIPYSLSGAYLNPLVELGDVFSIDWRGETLHLVVGSIKIRCNISHSCDLQNGVEDDDEDEIPYLTSTELQARRFVDTRKSYFGNRIDRKNGFVSELLQDGEILSRLVANGSMFTMQRYHNGAWEDCIYFDAQTRKYRLTGDVEVEGMITATDLSTGGRTTINGDNVTTGTIKAQRIELEGIMTANQYFKILEDGSMEAVNGKFSGDLQAAGGTFKGDLQAASGTFSGTLQAADGTFSSIYSPSGSMQIGNSTFRDGVVVLSDEYGNQGLTLSMDSAQGALFSAQWSLPIELQGQEVKFTTNAVNGIAILGRDDAAGYSQMCFYPFQTRTGNLGTPAHIWDTASIRAIFRESEGGLSSRKIKKKIRKLKNTSEIIDALAPVTFVYKDDPREKEHYGLIYEDTEPVAPLLCVQMKEDDLNPRNFGIDYSSISILLLKEVQELRKRVEALEKKGGILNGDKNA